LCRRCRQICLRLSSYPVNAGVSFRHLYRIHEEVVAVELYDWCNVNINLEGQYKLFYGDLTSWCTVMHVHIWIWLFENLQLQRMRWTIFLYVAYISSLLAISRGLRRAIDRSRCVHSPRYLTFFIIPFHCEDIVSPSWQKVQNLTRFWVIYRLYIEK